MHPEDPLSLTTFPPTVFLRSLREVYFDLPCFLSSLPAPPAASHLRTHPDLHVRQPRTTPRIAPSRSPSAACPPLHHDTTAAKRGLVDLGAGISLPSTLLSRNKGVVHGCGGLALHVTGALQKQHWA
ncbi:hypothetical protein TraAM80_04252 [Trypanosoma rangeli]|uniref:Uncharacterized protein n=1 Tax=Trypanosoma rangeli TaxID=5698 RepID=A0A422NKQ8_TRYRA|nr:uncharacterized protein TraAM80_04252 [Trypanosoma rangeli]RNF06004.1 hypothetical protein TraAM80_04252 [Trypanosoma rangeli]|eukprot:RNF06004.1 hypothetical protein TraAM80_04252 [Trypanosoma rangeli]